jgi:starvation-inducible DNA-binding protein
MEKVMKQLKKIAILPAFLLIFQLTAQEAPIAPQEVIPLMSIEKKSGTIPDIGLNEQIREEVAQMLNKLLADEYLLYTKTLYYHWNVYGPFFGDLHKFFGEIYKQLLCFIDMTAERVRALGYKADGTLQEFTAKTQLKEDPKNIPAHPIMLRNLLNDHETIIKMIRAGIDKTAELNDMGTNNFLCDLITKYEKTAWMLRSYLTEVK